MGNTGGSPRIANHALELADQMGYKVYLVGQEESENYEAINQNSQIDVINVPFRWVKYAQKLPTIIYFLVRCIIQTLLLFYIFFWRLKGLDIIFIQVKNIFIFQNPPSLPVLSFFWFYR